MQTPNLSGQTIGQYQIREMLGAGGMGTVYRAYQKSLNREVALKVLLATLALHPDAAARFLREAQTAALLEHTHIVPIFDYGTVGAVTYVAMRLLSGGSLQQRMENLQRSGQPLPSLAESSDILKQLASALDYAHNQGVIHRDIKASNVMFDNQGSAYLVDFGIAKVMDATAGLTGTGTVMGTPAYMSPEQWRGETLTPAADQYALGVMVYMLVTGRMPFDSTTPHALMYKHLNEAPTPPQAWRADASEAVKLVLERALEKKAENRFPTVTAFAQAFEQAIAGAEGDATHFFTAPLPKSARSTPPPSLPTPTGRRQRPALVWIVALIALVSIVAALALMNGARQNPAAPTTTAAEIALTATDEVSPTAEASATPGAAATRPPAVVIVPADTATPTLTDTPRPTVTPTQTDVPTLTPTNTSTATNMPTSTTTPTPTSTATTGAAAAARATYAAAQTITAEAAIIGAELTALFARDMTATATFWTETPTPTNTFTPTPTPPATDTPAPTTTLTPADVEVATTAPGQELTISARAGRTDTGILVQPGQTVMIEYVSGSWRAGAAANWPLVGPEGDAQVRDKSTFPVPNQPVMSLVAGIGQQPPVLVGRRLRLDSDSGGALWLSANDDDFRDNTGSLTVRVTVTDTAASSVTAMTSSAGWTPQREHFDGVDMVLVPPGCFMMGGGEANERPERRYCFDLPFWIDRTEVTNAQYGSSGDFSGGDRPREEVNWFEAKRFCESRGARLPTEAEWEYAARGPDSLVYPWGNTFVPGNLVYRDGSTRQTARVGSRPDGVSWVGALDMSGNVWEWTSSIHRAYPYDPTDGRENNGDSVSYRVLKGGSWDFGNENAARAAYRGGDGYALTESDNGIGFRCARDYFMPAAAPPVVLPPTPTPTPEQIVCPGALPSQLVPGLYARVTNGGQGNRMRNGASTQATQVGRIQPGRILRVLGGPVCGDGYAWWEVYHDGATGWTAEADDTEYWVEPIGAPNQDDLVIDPTTTRDQFFMVYQSFERGYMFYLQPLGQIWVLVRDRQGGGYWKPYDDTFREGEAELDPSLTAPSGLMQPARGFGKVWRGSRAVREALGWALTRETPIDGRYEYSSSRRMHTLFGADQRRFEIKTDGSWSTG